MRLELGRQKCLLSWNSPRYEQCSTWYHVMASVLEFNTFNADHADVHVTISSSQRKEGNGRGKGIDPQVSGLPFASAFSTTVATSACIRFGFREFLAILQSASEPTQVCSRI